MKAYAVAMVIGAMLAVSCGRSAPANPDFSVAISLGEIETVPRQVVGEEVTQNNCGGSAEAENEFSRTRTIVRELRTGTEFEVSAQGDVKVFGTGVSLGAAVASELGYTYGVEEEVARAITVRAAPGTYMQHEISHQEVWKVGEASVVVNDQRSSIPFEFRTDFALVLLESNRIPCPGGPTPIATFTPAPLITTALETATPPVSTPQPPPVTSSPVPTNTPVPPTATSVADGAAEIFIPDAICDPISLSSCQCTWSPQPFESDSESPMKDTWTLQNTGTGALLLSSEESTCPECFVVQHNPANGDEVSPQSHTQLNAAYYWDQDPLQGSEHFHVATIVSNAENCPNLEIEIRVRYR